MILNAYAVLDAFVTLLRLLVGVLLVGVSASLWRKCGSSVAPVNRQLLEDRFYLLYLLAFLLLGLNVASWPLLYLLLQSYVPQWPGAMCIYGVTQVGVESSGVARFLPTLLTALQAAKPALVFLIGAVVVLYIVNRRTPTAPLTNRILIGLVTVGLFAAADAAVEAAYLVIPKKEEFPSVGCCTVALGITPRARGIGPRDMLIKDSRSWLYAAYYLVSVAMVLALASCAFSSRFHATLKSLATMLVGALVSLPVVTVFLIEIAAPTLLHLPFHHCLYDLIPKVPESVVAIALFIFGCFSVGWACVAGWLADCEETRPFLHQTIRGLVFMGLFGYLGSAAMITIEMAIA